MSGSLSVEELRGQTANYVRKQPRKEGWKVRQSIIQAACPVGYDNRPLSTLTWVSAVCLCVEMCIVKSTDNLRYIFNTSRVSVKVYVHESVLDVCRGGVYGSE